MMLKRVPTSQPVRLAVLLVVVLSSGIWLPSAASAQDDEDERGQSVTDREKARLEHVTIPVGGFALKPQIEVDGSYDDNIFATDTDRRGDFYTTVHPSIDAHSLWSRHSLDIKAYFDHDFHAKYSSEDTSEYGISADGRYDVSHQTRIYLSGSAIHTAEKRGNLSSFSNTGEPVRYDSFQGLAAIEQNFGALGFRVESRVRRLSYSDAILADGSVDSQKFRDQTIVSSALQASYDLNTLTQFVIRGTEESRRYDLRPGDPGFDPVTQIDRSGDSTRIEAGIVRDLTGLLSTTVRVGYLNFRYPDPQLRNINAFSYYGSLNWNVTPLTTVSGTAQRTVDATTSPYTAGNLRDEISLTVDHELLRTLVISGNARVAWIKPSILKGLPNAIVASSREQEIGFEARYYFLPRLRFTGNYDYQARESSNKAIAFKENVITVGVSYVF